MTFMQAVAEEQTRLFPSSKWASRLPDLAREYRENRPFPHIVLKDFLDPRVAHSLEKEFPGPDTHAWTHYQHHNENKLGLAKRALFPPRLGEVADELNSSEFTAWLSELTGIRGLISDPSLEGGGLHQSGRGGFLNVHTDFSTHHYQKHWRRRVNLILYLNSGWQEEWGGAIELWDKQMRDCAAKHLPLLNHALIFTTDENSLHGFPEPLACPENVSRKSLALYYYTQEHGKITPRATNYRARPVDGIGEAAMIWLDKQAVNLYSRAKSQFGFSDNFVSRVLNYLSRRK